MSALSGVLRAIVGLLKHPVVQSALRHALIAATRELVRHATSKRASEHTNPRRVNRA